MEGLALGFSWSRGRVLMGAIWLSLGWAVFGGWFVFGSEALRKLLFLGSQFSAMGMTVLIEQALCRWKPTSQPQMVLVDGRRVSEAGFGFWLLALTLPPLFGFAVVPTFGLSLLILPLLDGGLLWVTAALYPLVLGLLLWMVSLAFALFQRARLAAVLHFAPREGLLARAKVLGRPWLGFPREVALCVALARLWSGEPGEAERAERELEELAPHSWQARQLLTWFQAGRGEADPAWLSLDPEPLGDRYRWSVALCLAALQSGRPELLRERVSELEALADALPNRFGALLRHLARRLRGDRTPLEADLAWIAAVWPFAA